MLRLAGTLRAGAPDCRVVIHHDPTGPALDRPALDRVGGVRQIPPVGPVEWGRGSQLDAMLAVLRAAVTGTDADWFVLLSGQDYLARPLAAVEAELEAGDWHGYVDGHVVPAPDGRPDEFQTRYFHRWRALPGSGATAASGRRDAGEGIEHGQGSAAAGAPTHGGRGAGRRRGLARASVRAALAAGGRLASVVGTGTLVRDVPSATLVGVPVRDTPFTPEMPCRRGQDWLTLSRRAAEALLRVADERPELVAYYRATVLPTESFPHTVLHAEPGLRLSGDSHRFVAFPPGSPHPRVLTSADTAAILASGTDFARKFDVRVDAAVLDALDAARSVRPEP